MLIELRAVTVTSAFDPLITLLVVIPNTSPITYPEPAVLLVKLIDDTWPELFVATVAVAPVPLPVIAYNGTLLYVWLASKPVPIFVTANVWIGPPICSI